MHTHPTGNVPLTPRDFKANKNIYCSEGFFFFSIFFLFYKNMHTQGMVGLGEDTRTHIHTLAHTHSHTYTHFLGPRPRPQKPRRRLGQPPLPHVCLFSHFVPLSQASAMWGRAEGWGNPSNRRLILGAVTRYPWDCVVLSKGDEGLAPLG